MSSQPPKPGMTIEDYLAKLEAMHPQLRDRHPRAETAEIRALGPVLPRQPARKKLPFTAGDALLGGIALLLLSPFAYNLIALNSPGFGEASAGGRLATVGKGIPLATAAAKLPYGGSAATEKVSAQSEPAKSAPWGALAPFQPAQNAGAPQGGMAAAVGKTEDVAAPALAAPPQLSAAVQSDIPAQLAAPQLSAAVQADLPAQPAAPQPAAAVQPDLPAQPATPQLAAAPEEIPAPVTSLPASDRQLHDEGSTAPLAVAVEQPAETAIAAGPRETQAAFIEAPTPAVDAVPSNAIDNAARAEPAMATRPAEPEIPAGGNSIDPPQTKSQEPTPEGIAAATPAQVAALTDPPAVQEPTVKAKAPPSAAPPILASPPAEKEQLFEAFVKWTQSGGRTGAGALPAAPVVIVPAPERAAANRSAAPDAQHGVPARAAANHDMLFEDFNKWRKFKLR